MALACHEHPTQGLQGDSWTLSSWARCAFLARFQGSRQPGQWRLVARKLSSQGEGSCTAYSEVSPLRQDAATLSQIRRKLRVRRKCHLQSGTNQPSAATAAATEAARGCHYPCRIGAGVDRAQDPRTQLTSGKSPAVPESKVSVWFCVSGFLSGPGAITCRGSSAADGVVRCPFSSQLGHQLALARVTSLSGSQLPHL